MIVHITIEDTGYSLVLKNEKETCIELRTEFSDEQVYRFFKELVDNG